MKNTKRILAGFLALTSVFSVTGCNTSGNSSDTTTTKYVDKVKIEDTNKISAIPDGSQKKLNWMGYYDLNPRSGAETSVELDLFKKKGGSIGYTRVTSSDKFDKLASAISANKDIPDIFKYEWMAFPSQVCKNMYQPIDSVVDFNNDLWKDVKSTADQFVLNNHHYVAPVAIAAGTVMMYDQAIIDEEGLDDPYDAYKKGTWNWTTWRSIMDEYVGNAKGDEKRFGVNGWFQPQIIQQTGKTMIVMKDNQLVSNINDPDIERAETFLYNLAKDGLVNDEWKGSANAVLSAKNTLFYCMGSWAMTGTNGPGKDDDWKIVPVPKDPNTDENYMTADITAYMWVKGSTSKDAVKTWFECCKVANTDETYKAKAKEKFLLTNPTWNDEMYQVLMDASSTKNKVVFDYGYGISPTMSDDNANEDASCITRKLYENVNKFAEDTGTQYNWTSIKDTYSNTIQQELDTINKAMKKVK